MLALILKLLMLVSVVMTVSGVVLGVNRPGSHVALICLGVGAVIDVGIGVVVCGGGD